MITSSLSNHLLSKQNSQAKFLSICKLKPIMISNCYFKFYLHSSYLDLYRDRKEINKEVLLDRLKLVDPFDYKKLYEKRKVPPALHRPHKRHHPTWYKATYFKKDFMLGPYRGLRNESAIQPLKNNADLDYPMWPMAKSLVLPMFYPYKDGKQKRIKDTKWVLPAKHHPSLRDEDEHIRENREEELKEDLKNVKEVTDSVLSRKL